MRARMLQQLNQVLETKDTARGLIVSMPDVLFDTGKADLKSTARERLAKVAGILIAYPDIHVEIDGYTDSTGSLELNERLSQERADAVRSYLSSQGVNSSAITTQGFGPSQPIASNDTASGRQQNRRVELVVSGSSIGEAAQQNAPSQNATSGAPDEHDRSNCANAALGTKRDAYAGRADNGTAVIGATYSGVNLLEVPLSVLGVSVADAISRCSTRKLANASASA